MSIKAGRQLIDLVKLCYDAMRPFILIGSHGVGKSALMKQAADELGIDFIVRDLSLMEPTDLVGLPKMDGAVTRYLPPSFLPTAGRGLLAFEELNRCPAYMRSPTLQLLTASTLNDYVLPHGWLPVAAINPSDSDAYEVQELDPALLSRFVRIDVVSDREEWTAWARANGIHPGVIAYAESDPAIFAESNPRSWTYVSDLLHAVKPGTPREALREAVVGLVGPAHAVAFFRVLRGDEAPLTADDVLAAYPRRRDRFLAWREARRLDLVEGSLHAVLVRLQAKPIYDMVRAKRAAWRNLGMFFDDLPGDLREQATAFFTERGYEVPRVRKSA
jgi:MoxR-like ATPase